MMLKKIVIACFALLTIAAIWYFFFKTSDLTVSFEAKTLPGDVHQTLKLWGNKKNFAKLVDQKNQSSLSQKLTFNDSVHSYKWILEQLNDSTTKVSAAVTDSAYSLSNRVAILLSDTDFEKRTENTVKDFMRFLNTHQEQYAVKINGLEESPSKYCLCSQHKTTQMTKASEMMKIYPILSDFTAKNNLALDGKPLIEITNWNKSNDSIAFNFCFPIQKSGGLPVLKNFIYRQLRSQKAIKATFNGNYIISDRAWYSLLSYAETNNLEIDAKPIEVFHNNPSFGGNEKEWVTEVYLPLIKR